ncbi:MAG: DUF3368 domain-containing protein [Planctomycetota bacterium]
MAAINHFHLLKHYFDRVCIPAAVWHEVVDSGDERPGVAEVTRAADQGWLEVVSFENQPLAQSLQRELHRGEAEAIVLALDQQADVVLLDETEARKVAERFGLVKTGVLGLLMRARRESKVASLQTQLARLRDEAGFWIADDLYSVALKAVGEI